MLDLVIYTSHRRNDIICIAFNSKLITIKFYNYIHKQCYIPSNLITFVFFLFLTVYDTLQEDTVEAYIFNDYGCTFYGATMQLLICGHIRPMLKYDSLDALIAAIKNDVRVGSEALDTEDLAKLKNDAFFVECAAKCAAQCSEKQQQE